MHYFSSHCGCEEQIFVVNGRSCVERMRELSLNASDNAAKVFQTDIDLGRVCDYCNDQNCT